MPDRARKKELKRLKRQEKARQLHKAQNVPPVRRVAMSGSLLDCWINANWREQGIASLLALGHAWGGSYVFAAFLIDIWCVGLKDAYGQNGVSRLDFEKDILKRANEAMPMIRFDATKARKLVASAIRFSRQNGFKLPAHYDRWTAIFGDLGDISSADLSSFGKDGKLFYMGTREFLQQRLIGTTPDEFLQRPDLQWTMPQGRPDEFAEYFEEDEDDVDAKELDLPPPEFHQLIDDTAARGRATMRQWCKDNGQPPHPRLEDGMMLFVTALLATGASAPTTDRQSSDAFIDFTEHALSLPSVVDPDDVAEALKQIIAAFREMPDELLSMFPERDEIEGEGRRDFTPSTVVDPVHPAGHPPRD